MINGTFPSSKEMKYQTEFHIEKHDNELFFARISISYSWYRAPNGNFRENICSEDDLRTRIFGTFVVKFLACLPRLEFSNIYKMV